MLVSAFDNAVYLFFRRLAGNNRWMTVSLVDEDGNPIGESKRVRIPEPEIVANMSLLKDYVTRLIASSARFTSLMIFTRNERHGFSVYQNEKGVQISVTVDGKREPNTEKRIREFFDTRSMTPTEDYLVKNGTGADTVRIILYPVLGDAAAVTELCSRFLREVYGVKETERLSITYREAE